MWYAVAILIELATGDVNAFVARKDGQPFAFPTEMACMAFITSAEADLAKHLKEYSIGQVCVKPVSGQDI